MARARARRTRSSPDEAGGTLIQLLGILLMMSFLMIPYFHALESTSLVSTSGTRQSHDRLRQGQEDLLLHGQHVCCTSDPTAGSALEDLAMLAWAGEPDPLVEAFGPWLTAPEATAWTLDLQWVPETGLNGPITRLYKTREPTGPTVGATTVAKTNPRAPGYLVPKLDVVTGAGSVDLHFVPLTSPYPYRSGTAGEHTTFATTTFELERTTPDAEETQTIERSLHTEISGGWTPAIGFHFEEIDFVEVLRDAIDPRETVPEFALVLSKEALAAERTLEELDCLASLDPLDPPETCSSEAHPHHGFLLDVEVRGPGQVAGAVPVRDHALAYQLEVRIPRNWTDVSFEEDDDFANDESGYESTTITRLPTNETRITALLNLTDLLTKELPEGSVTQPRFVVTTDYIREHPFRFHARPPSLDGASDVGFQTIEARLSSLAWDYHQDTVLVVELGDNPGRVHRTARTLVPEVVPRSPLIAGSPEITGVALPIGAVLLNGGEETDIERVTWRFPPGTLLDRAIEPLQDYTLDDALSTTHWEIVHEPDADLLVWEPAVVESCPPVTACAMAARVTLDGRPLQRAALWPPPELSVLYHERELRAFAEYFVTHDWGHHGAPSWADPPGFAIAHERALAGPGEVPGGFTFTLPPSSTPVCTARDVANRDQPVPSGPGKYRFGPVEDGFPFVGGDVACAGEGDPELPPCEPPLVPPACSDDPPVNPRLDEHTFAVVATAGTNAIDTHGVRSVARAAYTSVPGIPSETFVAWQNGISESNLTGPDQVRAGETLLLYANLNATIDMLTREGVDEATLAYRVLNPQNAWEDEAWLAGTLKRDAPLFHRRDLAPDPPVRMDEEPLGLEEPDPCAEVPPKPHCEQPIFGDEIIALRLPDATPPGTHLFLLEVRWDQVLPGGESIAQTGRILHPFDVLTPSGERARPGTLSSLAWLEDWG